MEKKNIVILTSNKYPDGDAGALRQHTMGKMFHSLGYNVMVYGMGESTSGEIKTLDGISYRSMRNNRRDVIGRFMGRATWVVRAVDDIKKRFEHIDAMLIVGDNPILFKKAEQLAKKYKCCIIHDSVEWYSPEEYRTGKLSIEYLMKEFTNRVAVKKPIKVIAISEYLEDYFSSKGLKTIRIPVIMDSNGKNPVIQKKNKKATFVYAGAPGKKDYIDIMLKGFARLSDSDKRNIELHIFGITEQQLITVCGVDNNTIAELGECLCVHGRVSHDEATEWVKNADVTILLRDEKLRYAQAGFPTKVVESMMYGTPVICNLSSDLGKYLKNTDNAYIASACDSNSFCSAIRAFLNTDKTQRVEINKNARVTAEKYFDSKEYRQALASFAFSKDN